MWRGKMATRWRRKDGHLTPGKGHFLPNNNLNEFEMDTHSSVDHSILAIFEDTSASENRAAAEEDREKLLSALSEMLESVEDDDDTLSPFSSLPQTSLLMSQDNTKCAISLSDVLGVEEKSDSEEAKETVNKLQNGAFFQPSNNKVDAEVEVFTSLSLVNLVKIMHPYCLKLQVEDELEKSSENSVLFSKEEVWKYQRPTEDTDEEINVVSDDEESKEATENTIEFSSKPMKSALLNAIPIKKKRVSFGPVQVTSFDLDSQTSDITSPATTHPTPKPIDDEAVLEAAISFENDQMPDTQKPEGKRKLLSLQQYRQLREKRQPLVEKQGNYTTKWPSVSVPPKELTPILGVNGQKHCKQIPAHNSTSNLNKKVHAPSELPQKAKRPRPNAKTQPNLSVTVCNKSPTKKQTIVSSDPPNPVLVPLSAQHPPANRPALHQNNSTLNCLQATEEKDLKKSSTVSTCNNHSIIQAEVKTYLPKSLDLTSHCSVHSPPLPYEPPTPVTTPVKEMPPEVAFGISLPSQHLPLCTSSGIEASDLTSLLEQFEETQAKEEGGSESAAQVNTRHLSKLDRSASNAVLQANPVSTPNTALHMSPTKEHSSTSPTQNRLKIPERFGTEVILSTREQPVKRKGPPVKAIQIIDPRPMPFKRTHTTQVESTFILPHVYSAILSDHDYCSVSGGNGPSKLNQTESIDIKEANTKAPDSCPKQTSEAVALITSAETNAPKEGPTKPLAPQPTLLTGGAKKLNCDIRMESCMVPPTPPPSPPSRDPDGTSLEPRDQDRTSLEPTERDGTSPEHGDRDHTSPVPRGRSRKSYRRRSRSSDSSSSSSSSSSSCSSAGSPSPNRKRHYQSSESSSCSSSSSRSASRSPPRRRRHFSRTRFSRSRSSSWSESRSRSRSYSPQPRVKRRRLEDVCSSSRQSRKLKREQEIRAQKLRAIDERRVVYVGRIRRTMTHEELRDRFVQFGDVESVSLHFRDRGDHYGFVTFYNMEDAFAAIDNGDKLRRPDELPFDICFGGRRQFCNSNYADLDANRDVDSSPVQSRFEEVDFDLLLKQAQKGLNR